MTTITPTYRKFSENLLYKVIDSERAVRVSLEDGIQQVLSKSALTNTTECTQKEFKELYSRTMEYLSELTFNTK